MYPVAISLSVSSPSFPLAPFSDLSLFFLSPASSPPLLSFPHLSLSLASSSSPRSPPPLLSLVHPSLASPLPPPTVHLLATPMAPSSTTTVPKRTLPPSPAPSTAPHHTTRTRPLTHTGPHTLIHLAGSHDPIKPPRSCGD